MIFIGDIASPNEALTTCLDRVFLENEAIFTNKKIICNFEGLVFDGSQSEKNEPVLYNHPSVIKTLNRGRKPVLCLSNNHILDIPEQFDPTLSLLKGEGIIFTGAGRTKAEAETPAIFNDGGKTIILFNACWDFLLYNHRNPREGVYIAEINEISLIRNVKIYKMNQPAASIIVFLHWSLDLETLPFPIYRQFSKNIIEAGASLVIGSHSHCIQGGEKHKDGYIVYSLGNFFIPHNIFAKGKIVYPEFSNTELVLDWDSIGNTAKCHWFKYQHDGIQPTLIHLGSEDFDTSALLKTHSPFQGMTDEEYYPYYKKNRRKKILIPVFRNYNYRVTNRIYTMLLKSRARFARFLAQQNLIKWQS